MKNLIYKTIFLASFLLVLGACEDKEFVELNPDANTVVSLSTDTVVLLEDTAADEAVTVSWTDPDFGFDAAPSYKIYIDFAGGDFSAAQIIPVGSDLSKVFTQGELNGKLLSLGVTPGEATAIDFMVETKLSDFQIMNSEPVTLTVTAYSSLLDLSTNWGVVGSATPGGWGNPDIPDLPFYTTDTPGVYVAYVTLRSGEIKFRLDNAWTTNYGDNGADGTLEQDGANIAVVAGTYKITVNSNDLTWSMEAYSWGIVGDATANGWGGPDFMMHYNSYQDNWKAVVTLLDGSIKFRFNNDWGLNYGDTGVDGILDPSGDNIAVTAGNYLVTMDLNTLEYTLEEIDVWGLVGDATPNGWGGPDTKFTPDFGVNEGTYYINGIELTNGEIKVRQNDAWGVNYGDDGNDGSLELNGANIPVTAGTYNVVVNFAVTPPTIALYAW
jgi:hypothetical protein